MDLHEELNKIEAKVLHGQYESEYDMQVDIFSLLSSAHDGHLAWLGDLFSVFQFLRGGVDSLGLVAVSSDGIETPQVYLASKYTPNKSGQDYSAISRRQQHRLVTESEFAFTSPLAVPVHHRSRETAVDATSP